MQAVDTDVLVRLLTGNDAHTIRPRPGYLSGSVPRLSLEGEAARSAGEGSIVDG